MSNARRLSVTAVFLLAALPASASQSPQRRDPPPEGRRLEARDGDVVVVENDDRVRLVRRRHATARVVVDETRNLVVVLADFAPAGGQPDGTVDQIWRYTLADGRWPLDSRWDGPVTIEEDEMGFGRPGSGLAIETASGVVIFDNTQQAGTDRRGAIAVLRFQAYAGSGRESRPLGFDDSERQQLSDNPPATSSASYSSFGPPPRPGMGATGGVSGGVAGGVWAGASSGAAPGAPGAPLRVGGGITPPRKIHDVKPRYPEEAVKNNVQGVVILEITVAEDGTVRHPRILRSIPMLDESAMEAVSQWQFEPPLLNGQPVPVIMTVTVAFAR